MIPVSGITLEKQGNFPARIRRFIITTFIGGLLIVLPITVFVLIVNFVVNFIVRLLTPVKELLNFQTINVDWLVDLIAFGIVIGAFFLIGLVVSTNIGRRFFQYFERTFLSQLPFYSTIRDTVQQIFGAKRMLFSEVVSVDVFSNDTRMIGFITDELEGDCFSVFVPTGPNPTNGFIFILQRRQIEWLKVKPDVAIRTVIGVGAGASALFRQHREASQE